MKLAVTIDVDGDIMYVPENTHGFVNFPKPKLFDTMEDACLLYTSPSPRDPKTSRMPSSA